MEIKVENMHQKEGIYSFTIEEKKINGITGTNQKEICNILNLKRNNKGKIWINNKELQKEDISKEKKRISIISSQMNKELYIYKVYEYMYDEIRRKKLVLKNPKKKMIDSLRIVGLDISYLNRNIRELSTSEKKLLQFSLSLMSNPDIIVIEEFLNQLDWQNEKKIMFLLEKIRDNYNKTIVLVSNSPDILYQYSTHIIITKNNEVFVEGNTKEIYEKVEFLKKNKIKLPEKVEWTYIAKKTKKAKIDYHKDIRDMIKDIYKHV